MGVLNKIVCVYREQGFGKLIRKILSSIKARVFVIAYVYKLDLDNFSFTLPDYTGFSFAEMTMEDLDRMHSIYGSEFGKGSYEDLKPKLADPLCRGYLVKNKNGDICGYGFMRYKGSKPSCEIKYVNLNENGYLSRDRIFKKYRGKGLQQYLIYNRLQILINQNYKTATTYITRANYASKHSCEKLGFKKCLKIIHLRPIDRKYFKVIK